MAAPVENSLNSRIFHLSEDDFQKEHCVWKTARLGPSVKGKLFLEVFPERDLKAIEVQGDEVTLPTPLVLNLFGRGHFEEKQPISVGSAPAGRVRFKTGSCFQFNVLLDPVDRSVFCVQTPEGTLIIPLIAAEKAAIPKLAVGITRAEVEKKLQIDGGLAVPFRYERYLVPGYKTIEGKVLKLNLAFKPAGMSDAIYYLGKWVIPKQNSKDVLMRISPSYLEMPFFD